jgi:sodium transport system ATP-binding protein
MDPTEGTVEIDGMNYKNNAIEIKKEIAFLSGNTKIYKDISPVELLTMCGEYYGLDKETLRKRINAIVKKLGMEEFKNQRIENLSTGQLQRTNLARCLIHDPKIYILDEATSGLDIISSKIILDFILEEKKKGKIVLYSTHYMEEAENICDEVLLIHKGKVITTGTPEEVNKKGKAGNLRDAFFNLLEDKYEN